MTGTEIPYRIRRSDRARRVRVTVDATSGVEVVLPRSASEREASSAVRELRPWIERRLAELEHARTELRGPPGSVAYLDERLTLIAEPGRTRVHRRAGQETILVPDGDYRPALERWYRRQARIEIAPRLDAACAAVGMSYPSLTIRAQRTRWASCGADGAMSFNWRLLLAPSAVLDAVVWHEVCHLEIRDHSPRFWALLESRSPECSQHQQWLRRYGAALSL
ncbi:MAG: SprT family zinc-dependent metalloprotease [Solirubrobacterales bacterium]|nr:SprT family zinc-dependent metalloprotease [Solirubrobacterales bacterium]